MFFTRPESGEKAVLVHLDFTDEKYREELAEFQELACSAGTKITSTITGRRQQPNPKTFVGSGKLDEIQHAVIESSAEVVLFNHSLSATQERNLERALKCRVLDRTGLILDIFAQRARTYEGKLQVELAQLEHLSTRLVRGWTHLERQKGGIGLRGPGETQLETDRRLLRARIKSINKRLDQVRKQRSHGRRARERANVTTISLVGYTNAGKSTLFKQLASTDTYVADQLFATLDPTMRKVELPHIGHAVLVDTVGFIRHLPHQLVEAFRATLEETQAANLLLHVIDANNTEHIAQMEQVNAVLKEINAHDIKCLQVYNKIDLLDHLPPRLERDEQGNPYRIWVSASTDIGIDLLRDTITELISQDIIEATVHIKSQNGSTRSRLYQQNAVLKEIINPDGSIDLKVRLPKKDLKIMTEKENLTITLD